MTIFLEIVKELLVLDVTAMIKASKKKDESYFSLLQNHELSAEKRALLKKLKQDFRELVDVTTEDSIAQDPLNIDHIKAIMSTCRTAQLAACRKYGYTDEGDFGPGIEKMKVFLENIYDRLNSVHLLNVSHDHDPLNIFRYHMARYFSYKIDEARKAGIVSSISQNPAVSSLPQLTLQKEEALLSALGSCQKKLRTLDSSHPDYEKNCKDAVIECLEKLERTNKTLSNSYGTGVSIPISISWWNSISVGVGSIGPDAGTLEKFIKDAKDEIAPAEVEDLLEEVTCQ